jgi:hypothetical protein
MKVVLRRRFVLHLSRKMVATSPGLKSLAIKPVDRSKKMKKEDS